MFNFTDLNVTTEVVGLSQTSWKSEIVIIDWTLNDDL